MANSAEIIYELKEKYEKLFKLYENANSLNTKAIKEASKLYLLLGEIKIKHPETIELINERFGEIGNDKENTKADTNGER